MYNKHAQIYIYFIYLNFFLEVLMFFFFLESVAEIMDRLFELLANESLLFICSCINGEGVTAHSAVLCELTVCCRDASTVSVSWHVTEPGPNTFLYQPNCLSNNCDLFPLLLNMIYPFFSNTQRDQLILFVFLH